MKYLKQYENNRKIRKGDYVLIKVLSSACAKDSINFIESNVGQIEKFEEFHYQIKFDKYYDYTNSLGNKCSSKGYWATENEIIYSSKNKEELEIIISSKKYNL